MIIWKLERLTASKTSTFPGKRRLRSGKWVDRYIIVFIRLKLKFLNCVGPSCSCGAGLILYLLSS